MKEKKEIIRYVLIGGVFLVLIGILFILRGGLTGFVVFEDMSENNFSLGNYNNTEWNNTGIMLKYWNDSEQELTDSKEDDGYFDMSGNVLLMHMNNDWNDTSGEGNDGTATGATFSTSSKLGSYAGNFDGNDYVQIDQSSTTDLVNNFTIALWVNPENQDGRIIQNNNRYGIRYNPLNMLVSSIGNGNYQTHSSSNSVPLSTWTNVVVIFSTAGNEIYINGQQDAIGGFNSDITTHGDLYVGRYASSYFNGKIDEFAIWDRSLSSREISEIYQRQKAHYGGGNSGTYTSQVFDASSEASWNNLTWQGSQPENLAFQVKNCSFADCSGEIWQSLNLSDLNLASRYFQYKANFSNPDSSTTSIFYNININYDLVNTAPVINIVEPQSILYISNESMSLNFIVSDADDNLDSCWYTIDSGVTNISLGSGGSCANTTFDIAEGSHTLNIYANDSLGLIFADSVSFDVDATGVSVTIVGPIGTENSITGIILDYTIAGNNDPYCWYNVKTSIGREVIPNRTLEDCLDSYFDLSNEGNYVLNLYVNNSLGSKDSTNSSFSVDTSETPVIPPSESPSGGGGGSSGSALPGWGRMKVSEIGDIIAHEGEQKILLLNVKNAGVIFLNNCKLVVDGEVSSWIYSTKVEGIAFGQEVDFEFNLNVPEGTEPGSYVGELKVDCDEGTNTQNISISIPGLQSIEVQEIIQEKDDLKINYVFNNVNNEEEVSVEIWIVDRDGIEIKRITDVFSVSGESVIEREVLIELPKSAGGIYSIYFALSSDLESFVKKSAVLGESRTVGMAILDNAKGKFGVYVVFLLFIGLSVFFIWKRHKENNQHTQKVKNRWLIRKKGKFAR